MGNLINIVSDAWDSLTAFWWVKGALAIAGAFIVKLLAMQHVVVAIAFSILVILDLITKQISISAQYISENNHVDIESLDVESKLWGIPLAISAGKIRSRFMRVNFIKKMATYFFAVAGAYVADIVVVNAPDAIFVNLMWSYLGATEFLSILENLRDGGNAKIGKIIELAEAKIWGKLK